MKKTLTIIILCLVYIVIYLLQINFFSWFTIAGIKPNLFIILVLFIGLYAGKRYGAILGAIFGLGLDLLGSNIIGQTAIIFGIIGFCGGYLDKIFSKDSKITVILMVIGATAICEIFIYTYRIMMLSLNVEIWAFIKILLIEILYNSILTIILYPLMQKLGYKVEEIFKNPQILTRYF